MNCPICFSNTDNCNNKDHLVNVKYYDFSNQSVDRFIISTKIYNKSSLNYLDLDYDYYYDNDANNFEINLRIVIGNKFTCNNGSTYKCYFFNNTNKNLLDIFVNCSTYEQILDKIEYLDYLG